MVNRLIKRKSQGKNYLRFNRGLRVSVRRESEGRQDLSMRKAFRGVSSTDIIKLENRVEHKLDKCFQCGSDVYLDWSGSREYYGMNDQMTSVMCSEQNGNCCVDFCISIDTNKDEDFNAIEKILVEAWNKICKLKKGE